MAGIPYFAGFFFKNGLFNQTIQAGYIALVIVAVVNSIISVGYYFKLILAMYTKNLMKKQELLCYLCGCRYCNCIEYRFGFISIFSFGLAGIKFRINIQKPIKKNFDGFCL
jgi:hypothetical protein